MVICLERDADLHMAQLMPLPLTVSCFSKIRIDFTFLVPAHSGSPGKRAVKRVCVCNLTLTTTKIKLGKPETIVNNSTIICSSPLTCYSKSNEVTTHLMDSFPGRPE